MGYQIGHLISYRQARTRRDDMSLELEPMMTVLNALARDTPGPWASEF
jgi:hypothetical protein